MREVSSTFDDHWSQPRLFYNSLTETEQQFLINAIRFETSHIKSLTVKKNVLTQLNRVSHDIAVRVGAALGLPAPKPDPTFYHDNTTAFVSIMKDKLPTVKTLQVAVLASTNGSTSLARAASLRNLLTKDGLVVTVVGESMADGVDQTYSAADARGFDGIIVAEGAERLFDPAVQSTLYPTGRPGQILLDGYRWGKPVAALGSASPALKLLAVKDSAPGVFKEADPETLVRSFEEGLAVFKFVDRFPLDE